MKVDSWDKDRHDTRSRGPRDSGALGDKKKWNEWEGEVGEEPLRGHNYIHARGYCVALCGCSSSTAS